MTWKKKKLKSYHFLLEVLNIFQWHSFAPIVILDLADTIPWLTRLCASATLDCSVPEKYYVPSHQRAFAHSDLYARMLFFFNPHTPSSTQLTDSSFSYQLKCHFSLEAWPDHPTPDWVRSPAECSYHYLYFTFKALIIVWNYLLCVVIYSMSVFRCTISSKRTEMCLSFITNKYLMKEWINLQINSIFIYSFNENFSEGLYNVPGIMFNTGDTAVNKTDKDTVLM